MAGSGFGTNFRITTWGETHGAGVGVVVDGCPAGLPLEREDVQKYLDRRKPGAVKVIFKHREKKEIRLRSFWYLRRKNNRGLQDLHGCI